MEIQAFDLYKQVARLQREVKDKEWGVIDSVKGKINQFKRTMPLIVDLKNKAIECDNSLRKISCWGKTLERDIIGFLDSVIT